MKKDKKKVGYIIFYRFMGTTNKKIFKAKVVGEKEKLKTKEQAIEYFRNAFLEKNKDSVDTLQILGARRNDSLVNEFN